MGRANSTTPSYNRLHYTRSTQPRSTPPRQQSARFIGILKWFNTEQQYGFIEYNANGQTQKDLFVHESAFICIAISEIVDIIGQCVQFNIETYRTSKKKAINVQHLPLNDNNAVIVTPKQSQQHFNWRSLNKKSQHQPPQQSQHKNKNKNMAKQ